MPPKDAYDYAARKESLLECDMTNDPDSMSTLSLLMTHMGPVYAHGYGFQRYVARGSFIGDFQ